MWQIFKLYCSSFFIIYNWKYHLIQILRELSHAGASLSSQQLKLPVTDTCWWQAITRHWFRQFHSSWQLQNLLSDSWNVFQTNQNILMMCCFSMYHRPWLCQSLRLIVLTYLVKSTMYEAPHYVIFTILLNHLYLFHTAFVVNTSIYILALQLKAKVHTHIKCVNS